MLKGMMKLSMTGLALVVVFGASNLAKADIREVLCDGCSEDTFSAMPGAQIIRRTIDKVRPHLPDNLKVDVMIVEGSYFAKRRIGPEDERHLLVIGSQFMIEMYNSWTNEFGWYDEGDEADRAAKNRAADDAFSAFVEWSFLHEVGHAVLDEDERNRVPDDKSSPQYHESFADFFATVMMLRLNQGQEHRAVQAASGILVLTLPNGTAVLDGLRWRNLDRRKADLLKTSIRKKGNKWSKLLGSEHSPNEERAWDILCLLYGAGEVESPGNYRGRHEGTPAIFVCERNDFAETRSVVDETFERIREGW